LFVQPIATHYTGYAIAALQRAAWFVFYSNKFPEYVEQSSKVAKILKFQIGTNDILYIIPVLRGHCYDTVLNMCTPVEDKCGDIMELELNIQVVPSLSQADFIKLQCKRRQKMFSN
jgi:hypothetical protein